MNPLFRRIALDELAAVHPGAFFPLFSKVPEDSEFSDWLMGNTVEPSAAEHPGIAKARQWLAPTRTVLPDGISVVPVHGTLARKPRPFEMAFYGVEDVDAIRRLVNESARDPETAGVLLDVDSPGGMITGGLELSDAVANLETQKPVVAFTSGLMASMGLHVASGASRIVASRSANVGSIGAIISYLDVTGYLQGLGINPITFVSAGATLKAAGAPGVEMTAERKAYFQKRVDDAGAEFRATLEARRGPLPKEATTGAVFRAGEAQNLGLVDSIGGMDWALANLRQLIRERS